MALSVNCIEIKVPDIGDFSDVRVIVTAGCAFNGDLASEECETILGMVANRDLIISTASGEWIVPSNFTALTAQVLLQSRHVEHWAR